MLSSPPPAPHVIPRQTTPPTPGQRSYTPYGGARQLFYCQVDEVLLEGPSNTGKSRALLEKLYLCACKYPGMRGLIVRKTRESLSESTLVTWETKVLPAGSPILVGADRHNRQRYDFPNGSEIVVGGMDKASRIMSTEYDLICVFEATEFTLSDLESLTTRVHNHVMPYNQVICDCNPGPPTHWLNERADAGQMRRLLSRHEDNPTITEDDLRKLRKLTGARRVRLYEGRWAAQEGQVYPEWDAKVHLIDAFPIPPAWRRWRVIDFGFTNPFTCQWWAEDGDGRLYLYRELYGVQRLVADWAIDIYLHSLRDPAARPAYEAAAQAAQRGTLTDAALVEWLRKHHPEAFERYGEPIICDHDAEDRATLERAGLATVPAHKEVSPGIQALAARLRKAGDGRPRLFVFRSCLVRRDPRLVAAHKPCSVVEEWDGYVWEKTADGQPNKETPHKEDDHGMDTARYMVMQRAGRPTPPPPPPRVVGASVRRAGGSATLPRFGGA